MTASMDGSSVSRTAYLVEKTIIYLLIWLQLLCLSLSTCALPILDISSLDKTIKCKLQLYNTQDRVPEKLYVVENKTLNDLFYFTLKAHGGLWGELPAAQYKYGSAAADGWRMNPEGLSVGAEEAQHLQGHGFLFFLHTCS